MDINISVFELRKYFQHSKRLYGSDSRLEFTVFLSIKVTPFSFCIYALFHTVIIYMLFTVFLSINTGGCQKKRAPMKIVIVSIIIKLWRDGSPKGVAIYSVLKIVAV